MIAAHAATPVLVAHLVPLRVAVGDLVAVEPLAVTSTVVRRVKLLVLPMQVQRNQPMPAATQVRPLL